MLLFDYPADYGFGVYKYILKKKIVLFCVCLYLSIFTYINVLLKKATYLSKQKNVHVM